MAADDACGAVYRNHILAALPIAEIELLRPHLSRMTMVSGQVLHEANSPITDVFFIENGVVSLAADTHDEGRVEVGLLGREGFAGASVILNAEPWSVHRAFAQVRRRRISNECYCTTVCCRAIRKPPAPMPAPR